MDRDHIPQRKTFYLMLVQGRNDGLLDLTSEEPTIFGTLDEAVEGTTEEVDEHGMPAFIYECRPVRRVHRIQTVVETIVAERSEKP